MNTICRRPAAPVCCRHHANHDQEYLNLNEKTDCSTGPSDHGQGQPLFWLESRCCKWGRRFVIVDCLANVGQVALLAKKNDHDCSSYKAHAYTKKDETHRQTVGSVVLKINLGKGGKEGCRGVSCRSFFEMKYAESVRTVERAKVEGAIRIEGCNNRHGQQHVHGSRQSLRNVGLWRFSPGSAFKRRSWYWLSTLFCPLSKQSRLVRHPVERRKK
jgi:hypothetical protein